MGEGSEVVGIQYFVLSDRGTPYLLARVRWPDVAQAMSAGVPFWQYDPGLFDLPYAPSSLEVTLAQASSIASGWGADLLSEATPGPLVIRRMPANWSHLSPAERHTWSLESVGRRRTRAGS